MDQKDFLQKSDELINKMSIEQLNHCLHEIARKTNKNQRNEFLQILQDKFVDLSENRTLDIYKPKLPQKMSDVEVMEKIYYFEETFRKIEEGELEFSAHEYENDYEDYWDRDWEISHSDPEGLGKIIEEAVAFAYDCINDFRYKESLFIFDSIMDLNAESYCEETGNFIELSFQEIMDENLVSIDTKNLALNALYAKYQTTSHNKRPEKLYEYFAYPFFKNIQIEEIISIGREEVRGFDKFLQSWVKFLIKKSGDTAAGLLKDAIVYHKGYEGLIDVARESDEMHPSLYLESIKELEKNFIYEKVTEIGKEALEKIDPKLKIRGTISLKTAQASFFTGKTELMYQCWYETFLSITSVPNFLRLFINEISIGIYKDLAVEKLESIKYSNSAHNKYSYMETIEYSENEENIIDEITYKILHFFKGDFEKTQNWCKEQKNPLGWTGEFIWYGVRLMLLYLYDDKKLNNALKKINLEISESIGFKCNKNLLFIEKNNILEKNVYSQKGDEIFREIFCLWKIHYKMTNSEIEFFITWLQNTINNRVTAIINGQFRGKYEDIAILITAIGEVKESLGEDLAKSTLLEAYHKKYPRHNAFRAQLRKFV